jgi:hypothetical protein
MKEIINNLINPLNLTISSFVLVQFEKKVAKVMIGTIRRELQKFGIKLNFRMTHAIRVRILLVIAIITLAYIFFIFIKKYKNKIKEIIKNNKRNYQK